MKLSVCLTLGGHGSEKSPVECIAEGLGSYQIHAKVGHDAVAHVDLSVGNSMLDYGGKGYGDNSAVLDENWSPVEEDDRSMPFVCGDQRGSHGINVRHAGFLHDVQCRASARLNRAKPSVAAGLKLVAGDA